MQYMKRIPVEHETYKSISKNDVYYYFSKYFNDPIMTKVKIELSYAIYAVKIKINLNVQRYIICISVHDGSEIGTKRKLSDISWQDIQMRTLDLKYDCEEHSYIPTRLEELNRKIKLTMTDKGQYTYVVDGLPLKLTLLSKDKKDNGYEYNREGTLVNAIETYQTVIDFV